MSDKYYLCNVEVAQRCCSGLSYVEVYVSEFTGLIYEKDMAKYDYCNAILLKDISGEMYTILKLCDDTFQPIIGNDFCFTFNPETYHWKVL